MKIVFYKALLGYKLNFHFAGENFFVLLLH